MGPAGAVNDSGGGAVAGVRSIAVPVSSTVLFPRHWEVIAVATATTNLLNTPNDDQRVERVRRAALSAYVDGKISYAQANLRVRRAIERFAG